MNEHDQSQKREDPDVATGEFAPRGRGVRWNPPDARAVEYFQRGIDRDQQFARAYAMMAEAYMGWASVSSGVEHPNAAERVALSRMDYWQQFGPPDECELKNNKLTCH